MSKYYPPKFNEERFHCILCGVFSKQTWGWLYFPERRASGFKWSYCDHCQQMCYWYDEQMVVPSEAPVPPPHQDLPTQCLTEYHEARNIVARSPRAAVALLRLCIQKLLTELGESGKNINDDIGSLVKKGLPVQVQRALDFCRVIGNNAVHPGEIMINDSPEIAHNLFNMINYIVEDRISRPKQIENLYCQLPEGARKAIEERDKAKE